MYTCICRKVHRVAALRSKLKSSQCGRDVLRAIQSVATHTDTDNLIMSVERAYLYDPPDEIEMRRLSNLQQAYAGQNDAVEYATLTAFLSANAALIRIYDSYTEIQFILKRLRLALHLMEANKGRVNSCPELFKLHKHYVVVS